MSIHTNPAITCMRNASIFMRSIAALVLVTFTSLIVSPTVMAIENAPDAPAPVVQSDEAKLSKAIQHTQRKLEKMADKLNKNEDISVELTDLQALKTEITTLNDSAMAGFDTVKAHIQSKNLPQTILDRHNAVVNDYQSQLITLLQNLADIETSSDIEQRKTKVNNAKNHLKGKKHKRSQQPFDPNNLPNKNLKPKPGNTPKQSKEEFTQAGLFDTPYAKLAALGDFTFDKLNGASDPAYLAATPEITLSQAIQDQATALNHDPVKIYHWVRNNIQWLPTMGAMQDADLTLGSKRGNSADIASLTISLLRASGIPSRYVHGTIEIKKANFLNWAGGFTNIDAAIDFVASGGIPVTPVTSGGQIVKVRIEHLWVEAAIDFQPSRGAKNFAADSWVYLDPSYKQYTYQQGLDAVAISGIDAEQLVQDFSASGTINEAEGWVTGFDPTLLQAAQNYAQTALQDHITNNMTDPKVGDVIGGRKTIVQEYPVLPSALPNKIIVTGARYDAIPSSLQQSISFSFSRDVFGYPNDPLTLPWPQLNNQKITLSFKPATADDEAALQSLLPDGEITDVSQLPTSIPAYLINVIPELKLNGTVIKSGNIMTLGQETNFGFDANIVGYGTVIKKYNVVAGSYLDVAVVGQSVSPEQLTDVQTKLTDTKTTLEFNDAAQIATLTQDDLLGDMFYAGMLGYYAQYLALSHIAGLAQNGHHTLMAGLGSYGYEPNVDTFFGIPRAITTGGVVFNLPIVHVTAVDSTNTEEKKNLTMQIGIISSVLEHAVPEQMFTTDPNDPADAVSAVKALSKATQQGQRIYHITGENKATALPNIHHDTETMAEISAALQVGKEVITHTDTISVPGWSGAGYIIFDPLTGDGAYKISGGANGGWLVIAAFVFLGALVLISALSLQWGVLFSASLAFISLSKEIQSLAADDSLTEEEFIYKTKVAISLEVVAAVLPFLPGSSNPQGQAKDLAFKIVVSSILSLVGLSYF